MRSSKTAWRLALRVTAAAAGLALFAPPVARAQETPAAQAAAKASDTELAKKLSNPIADLVSVPFQFNWAQGTGPDEETRFILNVQPVMPFTLTKDWNLIARVIVPFIGQPALVPGGAPATGLGDITTSFFLTPSSGKLVWGVGPVLALPTTQEPTLGSGKWSAGPTVILLKQEGRWTVGLLWNQQWSYAGSDGRAAVNQMYVQPFLSYTTRKLFTFARQQRVDRELGGRERPVDGPGQLLRVEAVDFRRVPRELPARCRRLPGRPRGRAEVAAAGGDRGPATAQALSRCPRHPFRRRRSR